MEKIHKMKVAVVLPRNMTFKESGATSIDLIVRDQVLHSSYGKTSIVIGPQIDNPFSEINYHGVNGKSQSQLNQAYLDEIQRYEPDIVIVHQYPKTAYLLAKNLPPTPVILYRHGLIKPRTSKISKMWKIRQFKPISKIIFVSEFIKSEFLTDFSALNSKCVVIGNAIDTNFWRPAETKESRICYVGRALIEKGIIELIEGFRILNLPDWQLDIIVAVSTDREIEFFKRIQQEIIETDQINLMSNLTINEVQESLSRSKIATLPSIVREGFPRSVMESMSCGCATIASRSGGTPEVVGSSAILLNNVTSDSIFKALDSLTKHPDQIESWGASARNHAVQHLGINSHIKKYDAELSSCVNN